MTEHYQSVAQDELSKIEQYRLIYEATHPYPEKKSVSFLKELGLESGMLILSAVGSIILSAIRTSTIFMLTEALLIAMFDKENLIPDAVTQAFPITSMIVSLVAFEGYLSAHGFINGKKSKSIEVSAVAMWLCFGVTIMAGMSASFGLLGVNTENMIFQFISWILAVLTAIGAPVVAYYGSLNLGVILNQWDKINYDIDTEFENDIDSWNSSFFSSFSSKRSQKLFGVQEGIQNEQYGRNGRSPLVQTRDEHLNKSEQCYEFVNDFVHSHERLPTMTEVEEQGFSRGLASNIVNKYIFDNKDFLISINAVEGERLERVLERFN